MHIQSFAQSECCFYGLVRLTKECTDDRLLLELIKNVNQLQDALVKHTGYAEKTRLQLNRNAKAMIHCTDILEERIIEIQDFCHNLVQESDAARRAYEICEKAKNIKETGV